MTLGTAAGATFTVSVKTRLSPATIGPLFVAVTVPPAAAKLHPAPKPETKLRPAGSGSVTVIGPVVAVVPTLGTERRRVGLAPSTNAAVCRFAIARSGAPPTAVRSEAVLFAAYGSPEVLTVAVLMTLGTAAGATFTVSVNTRLSPATIGPLFVAVTVPPAAAKFQPAPVPETKLRPAGSGSVTVIGPVVGVVPTLVTTSV